MGGCGAALRADRTSVLRRCVPRLALRESFVVRYEPSGQPSLAFHRDSTLLSCNVLLSSRGGAAGFDGGGTCFAEPVEAAEWSWHVREGGGGGGEGEKSELRRHGTLDSVLKALPWWRRRCRFGRLGLMASGVGCSVHWRGATHPLQPVAAYGAAVSPCQPQPRPFRALPTPRLDASTVVSGGQGDCLLHCGQLMHGAQPVTRGMRAVLVCFIDELYSP